METTYRKVSVQERLPENDKQVFVIADYTRTGGRQVVFSTSFYRDNGYGWNGQNLPVTDWLEEIKPEKSIEGEITEKDFEYAIKNIPIRYEYEIPVITKKLFSLAQQMCEAKEKEIEKLKNLCLEMSGNNEDLEEKIKQLKSNPSKSIEQ